MVSFPNKVALEQVSECFIQISLRPLRNMLIGKYIVQLRWESSLNVSFSVAPAISNNYSKPGVVVNFVTATGGDVEMLRSIECFYKCVI